MRGADAIAERPQGKQRPEMTAAAVATLHNSINAFLTVITQRKYQFVRRNKFNEILPSSSASTRIPGFAIIIDSFVGGFSHAMLFYFLVVQQLYISLRFFVKVQTRVTKSCQKQIKAKPKQIIFKQTKLKKIS